MSSRNNSALFMLLLSIYWPIIDMMFLITNMSYIALRLIPLIVVIPLLWLRGRQQATVRFDTRDYQRFHVLMILMYSLQFTLLLTSFRGWFISVSVYITALFILNYFQNISHDDAENIVYSAFKIISIIFILQLVLSAYESTLGSFIAGGSDWNDEFNPDIGLDFKNRALFAMLSSSVDILSVFKLPFSGLLGQHNYWGTQLPFYNIVFIYLFLHTRSRWWLVMCLMALIAVIFNTSRFGIFSILITDLILLYVLSKHKRLLVWLAVVILVISSFSILPSLIEAWNTYFERVDTLTLRSNIYERTYEYFFEQDIAVKMLGTGSENFLKALMIICPETLSQESEFVGQIVFSGVIGLCLFVGFLIMNILHAVRCRGYQRLMGLLLVLNMILVSVTSNLLFIISIYPIVILCAVANSSINTNLVSEGVPSNQEISKNNVRI